MAIDVLESTVAMMDTGSVAGGTDLDVVTTADNVPANSTMFAVTVGWQGYFSDPWAQMTVRTASGGGGTTYDRDVEIPHPSNNHVITLHRLSNVGSGSTVTAYFSSTRAGEAGTWDGCLFAVSGVKLSSPLLDVAEDAVVTEDPTSPAVTATAAGQLVLAAMYPVDYQSAVTVDLESEGWTLIANYEGSEPFNLVYKITTGAGDYTTQWGRSSNPSHPALMVVGLYDAEPDAGGQPIVKRFGGVPFSIGQLMARDGVQIF